MFVLKSIMGWLAVILFVVLAGGAELLGSRGLSKILWWLAAFVAIVAAVNTTSYS